MGQYDGYIVYEEVDDKRLLLRLSLYNKVYSEFYGFEPLRLTDIEAYLSDEFNDEGQYRILNRPENITDYINYVYYVDFSSYLDTYKIDLETVCDDLQKSNEEYDIPTVYGMSIEQLEEVIEKEAHPDYEIDMEVFPLCEN